MKENKKMLRVRQATKSDDDLKVGDFAKQKLTNKWMTRFGPAEYVVKTLKGSMITVVDQNGRELTISSIEGVEPALCCPNNVHTLTFHITYLPSYLNVEIRDFFK